jgi:hypothetical protein
MESGLNNTHGWWNCIEPADLDLDGDIDFVLGNHGWNSMFKASSSRPVTMYVNDFDNNGKVDHVIGTYRGDTLYPMVMRDELVNQMPYLRTTYPDHKSYAQQSVEAIFSREQLDRSVKLIAETMASSILINHGKGKFELIPLPKEAQFSPVYAIHIDDFTRDGTSDILLGGNQYRAKPETGIYDGSYGLLLKGIGNGIFAPVEYLHSGFFVKGEIRDLEIVNTGKDFLLIVARNNDTLKVFKY